MQFWETVNNAEGFYQIFSEKDAFNEQYGVLTDLQTITFTKKRGERFLVTEGVPLRIEERKLCEDSKYVDLVITCIMLKQIKVLSLGTMNNLSLNSVKWLNIS